MAQWLSFLTVRISPLKSYLWSSNLVSGQRKHAPIMIGPRQAYQVFSMRRLITLANIPANGVLVSRLDLT
jgi:hypothetical protein